MANEQPQQNGVEQQQQAQGGEQQQGAEGQVAAAAAAEPAEVKAEETSDDSESQPSQPARHFTPEQLERKVLCRTFEGDIVEAPWHLMVQSRTFANMWDSLGLEECFAKPNTEPFIFPLNEITKECFEHILDWMREHHGLPEPTVKEDPVTTERIWFKFTDWERTFFNVDFETVKEYYLAANFLELRSLYLYCAQECARCIMDKTGEEIREMLCLPDDLTDEDKAKIAAEFDIPQDDAQPGPSGEAEPAAGQNGEGQQPGTANGVKKEESVGGNGGK